MAEPKKRLTSARSGARRSHLQAKKINLSECFQCHQKTCPHHICPTCGYYKGIDILKLEEKTKAKAERRQAKEEAEATEEKAQQEAEKAAQKESKKKK